MARSPASDTSARTGRCACDRRPEYFTFILRPHFPHRTRPCNNAEPFARRAATLTGRARVRQQPPLGVQVLLPGHVSGMVLGDQDPPLRDRRLDLRDLHTPVGVDRLDRPVAPIRIRARVVRVGQDLMHSTVIRRLPTDPPLGDPPAREPLPSAASSATTADRSRNGPTARTPAGSRREPAHQRPAGSRHPHRAPSRSAAAAAARHGPPCSQARRATGSGSDATPPPTSCPSTPTATGR